MRLSLRVRVIGPSYTHTHPPGPVSWAQRSKIRQVRKKRKTLGDHISLNFESFLKSPKAFNKLNLAYYRSATQSKCSASVNKYAWNLNSIFLIHLMTGKFDLAAARCVCGWRVGFVDGFNAQIITTKKP